MSLTITLIGGPTALVEIDGFRLLTDPTFDAPGEDYQLPHVKLEKLVGPAMSAADVGEIDAVLLSHDQHSDNLDHSGRDFLKQAKRVLTTEAGAGRLGGNTEGFAPWGSTELKKGGQTLTITATPARHGPAGIEPLSGDVIGFVVESNKPASARSTSAATPPGSTAWPKWQGASRPAWCCRSPARRRPAVRSILPWTPTTPSRPRARSRTR
jgi:L-ascorbate metabolism protein UlaG (beta-lactamase superfamily)